MNPTQQDPGLSQRPRIKRRKRGVGWTILKVFLITVGILILIVAGFLFVYGKIMGRSADLRAIVKALGGSNLKDAGDVTGAFSGVKEHTNFIILGTDADGTRTDVMMVGTLNSKDDSVTLISVPRDTYTTMPQARRDILKEHNVWPPAPASGVMKMNEVYHYATEAYGVEFVVKQIEEMMDIQIEYYLQVDLAAFRYIVDEIGGVEFDVPQRMFYEDRSQGLRIDLQPGLQRLYGKDAEGLVRFRTGYAQGDVTRTGVQQAFMKALLTQMMSKDKFWDNAPTLLSAIMKYVKTNFNPVDLPKFLPYMKKLSGSSIKTYTLPGTGKMLDRSYFIPDEDGIAELVELVFNGGGAAVEPESSKGKTIQVLNGGSVSGLAGRTRDMLEGKGFTVDNIGDYSGTRMAHTRIFVKKASYGADLQALFPGSEIEVKPSATDGYDIVVILGTNAE